MFDVCRMFFSINKTQRNYRRGRGKCTTGKLALPMSRRIPQRKQMRAGIGDRGVEIHFNHSGLRGCRTEASMKTL